MEMSPERKERFHKGLRIALVVFIAVIVANIVSGNLGHNDNYNNKQINTISLSGHGEVMAVPDIANINFTVREVGKTVKEADDVVAPVVNKAVALLKTNGVADKDIKTESVSFNPKYSYQYGSDVICGALTCPPRPTKEVITGYEAYENISVKVRNIDSAGAIVSGLGAIGVMELTGPDFAIDNQDGLKAQAQKIAIDDAQAKAKVLAKNLGVRLGEITSFNESGNYPMPMYASAKAMDNSVIAPTPAVLPTGENTITSDVTITYEIR
jgi:hypothetical protein